MFRKLTAVCALLLVGSVGGTTVAQLHNHNSYLGQRPPELVAQREHWLGWSEPVTLEELKGQVVWLQFNF